MNTDTQTLPSPAGPAAAPATPASLQRMPLLEKLICLSLGWGVILSSSLMFLGLGLYIYKQPGFTNSHPLYLQISDPKHIAFPTTLAQIGHGLAHHDGLSWITLGLLVLVATPILRVALTVGAFAFRKDKAYLIITAIVFTLLVTSFFMGKH